MYEGAPDYPDKDIWWELVERYKVTLFYTAPTAIRACMKWGAEHPGKHDLSSLRLLGTVGEPINPKAWLWYHKVIGGERCPIVDTWWQTETGAIMITTLPGIQDTKPGSAGTPLPGIEAAVVTQEGEDAGTEQGFLTLRKPWPAMLRTLYKEEDRFVETYWSKYGKDVYFVGDAARRDEDGYFWIIGRVDDVINVSGHRLSTAEVESAIVSHERVAEAAVIGQQDEDTGPGDHGVRDAVGHRRRRPTSWSATSASTWPSGSASSRGPSASSGPTTCPRRARARSCAACCATSPRAASWATSRRCATRT